MPDKKREVIRVEIPSKALRVRHAMCQNGHSLMDTDHTINGYASVAVRVKYKNKEGVIYLDPVYGSFRNVQEMQTPENAVVEFFCPVCGDSLKSKHHKCQECSADMFEIFLPSGGTVVGCLRNGCHFHILKLANGEKFLDSLNRDENLELFL